eukprot:822452_1
MDQTLCVCWQIPVLITMSLQVSTPGNEVQREGINDSSCTQNNNQPQLGKQPASNKDNHTPANAENTLFKFNKIRAESQQQLHRCYHAKQSFFEQFAAGLGFASNELCFLSILIETNLCDQCGTADNTKSNAFEKKQQQNCDKINAYFDEITTQIQQYHQTILQSYKTQSDTQFRSANQSTLEIEFTPIKEPLDALLSNCYEIIDSDQPDPPQIEVKNGDVCGLVIEILDKDKSPNDKYEIVMNDTFKKEYINDDNKQQYIELIDDIKPLTYYTIKSRRYIGRKQRWSKYCTPFEVFTSVTFAWSKQHRGSNAKLSNLSRDVYCKSKKGSCSIVTDEAISAMKFKQVTFSFEMHSLAQFSYCGFVECSDNMSEFEENMRPYWDALVVKNSDSYCLGFCNGSNSIQRWMNGNKKGKSKWKSKDLKLQNSQKVQNGDVLLFHIDFERLTADVYLNHETKQNKISADADQNTFVNIPSHIIPVYSHENNPYIIAHSKVTINLKSYVLR